MFYKENTNSLINNLREMFYKITIKNDVDSNLDLRMRKLVTTYNNRKCHGFQPFVISLKCKSLMKYVNELKIFQKKLIDKRYFVLDHANQKLRIHETNDIESKNHILDYKDSELY